MKKKIIIEIKNGGLGDHLFYSHLPKIFSSKKIETYISLKSKCRNADIINLVWKNNPYVHGFTDSNGDRIYRYSQQDHIKCNLLDIKMLEYGIDDGLRCHEPEVYYQPNSAKQNYYIIDFNYISFVGVINLNKLQKIVSDITKDGKVFQLKIRKRGFYLPNIPVIETNSIYDYIDKINASKKFICLTSGSATLAAALKIESIVFYGAYQNKIFHHSSYHKYIDVGKYSFIGFLYSKFLRVINKIRVSFD